MKVLFGRVKETEPVTTALIEKTLYFSASKPVIVQPSEIMKVPTNSAVKVTGDAMLLITTCDQLAVRLGEIFPGTVTITPTTGETILELTVRNVGRNPISIMAGQPIAQGHLVPIAQIEMEDFSISTPETVRPKTKPQKRNDGFKFEVKN